MTLGERIQVLRKDAGLSQEELGEKLGVARQSVSKWESDATVPELDKLMAMSKLFGISIGALLGLEESDGVDRELTDRELATIEAIAQKLAQKRENEKEMERFPVKWTRRFLLTCVAVVLVAIGVMLVKGMDSMASQISALASRVYSMDSRVSQEIGILTHQVKGILEERDTAAGEDGGAANVYGNLQWGMTGQKEDIRLFTLTATVWQGGTQEISPFQGTLRLWNGEELFWSRACELLDRDSPSEVDIPFEGLTLIPGKQVILSFLYTDSAGEEREVFLDGFLVNEAGIPTWMAPYVDEWNRSYPWKMG